MSGAGEKVTATLAFQFCLAFAILLSSVIGNGLTGALLVRFKQLRTVQNILIANVAVIHVLNAMINIPGFVIYTLHIKLSDLVQVKSLGVLTGSCYSLFYNLNLFSMLCMATDRYAAMVYGIRYLTWKTQKKACLSVVLVWALGAVCTIPSYVAIIDTKAETGYLLDYLRARFKSTAGLVLAAITVPIPLVMIAVLTAITCRTSNRARRTVCGVHEKSCQTSQMRIHQDVRAAKATILTFAGCFISYLPSLVYAIYVTRDSDIDDRWFGYFAALCPFLSGVFNPLVHLCYSRRFRHALAQFCKSPCGTTRLEDIEITELRPRETQPWLELRLTQQIQQNERVSGSFRWPFTRRIHPLQSADFTHISSDGNSSEHGKAVVISSEVMSHPK